MIERIVDGELELALIIRRHELPEGIRFVTHPEATLQVGYMRRTSGYTITPHLHIPVERTVSYTQEVLVVQSGSVRVDFYDERKVYLRSVVLHTGDVVLLARGGHGFEFLEESQLIEVKQGPYGGGRDKERFASNVVVGHAPTGR